MSAKRILFLTHRWLGIVLCLFFALWFVSGLFMMYVEFPTLTPPERLAGESALDFSRATLAPGDAVARLQAGHFHTIGTPAANLLREVEHPDAALTEIDRVQLGMLLGRPVYRVFVANAQPRVVFADTGEVLREVTPAMARAAAIEFAERRDLITVADAAKLTYAKLVQTDQWTVSAALNGHRPLHRIALNDGDATDLYVSSSTGEVVRDTHRSERWLNYAGAVTHWLYPTFIRRHPDAWAWMVDVLSFAGTIAGITGMWIGILRWRKKRRRGPREATGASPRRRGPKHSYIPYRGMMRWHHITGLVFGLTALTWVFSGLLSMNPGKMNPPRSASSEQLIAFNGPVLAPTAFAPFASVAPRAETIDAELLQYDGQPFYETTDRHGVVTLIAASSAPLHEPAEWALIERAPSLMPGTPLARIGVLRQYDDYYFTRRPEQGAKSLPIVRAEFADAEHTWFHIDVRTGQVLERSTRTNRVYRWLYNGLHSWDIKWLWDRRPLWDIAVILFSLGGIGLSIIGLIVGWRRLRHDLGIAPLPKATRARGRASLEPSLQRN